MWIHLKNEEARATLNLNFTVFFSITGLEHKKALKQIVYFYGCSVKDIDDWFKIAIEEFHEDEVRCDIANGIPKLDKLIHNYEYFKKTYITSELTTPIVKRIYKYEPKFNYSDSLDKCIMQYDNNTIILADSMLFLMYDSIFNVSAKEQYAIEDKQLMIDIASNIREAPIASGYIHIKPFNKLKDIADVGYLQVDDCFFDIKPALQFLDTKSKVLISSNIDFEGMPKNVIMLMQRNLVESVRILLSSISFEDAYNIMTVKID